MQNVSVDAKKNSQGLLTLKVAVLELEVDLLLNILKLLHEHAGCLLDSGGSLLLLKCSVENGGCLNPVEGHHVVCNPLVSHMQIHKQVELLLVVFGEHE